jgi:hypothetical protein
MPVPAGSEGHNDARTNVMCAEFFAAIVEQMGQWQVERDVRDDHV